MTSFEKFVAGIVPSDRPYFYSEPVEGAHVGAGDDTITVTGRLAGLELKHTFHRAADQPWLEEQITLCNPGRATVEVPDFEAGFLVPVTDAADRIVAIPLRKRADDPAGFVHDFAAGDLLTLPGSAPVITGDLQYSTVPSPHQWSEGWAWTHGAQTLGIFKFNQTTPEFSTITAHGDRLRVGGVGMLPVRVAPGQTLTLGLTRYETMAGDYRAALTAFRRFLDEHGCRFPADYNPPLQWNELYDNPDWTLSTPGKPPRRRGTTRRTLYTHAAMEAEAAKAQAYHCEALYLDPGWDTEFGSFKWADEWMGDMPGFGQDLKRRYGLELALHCPLATWVAVPWWQQYQHELDWPVATRRHAEDGTIIPDSICLGSQQYLDEAARRLLELCRQGATFLMFDGNWWNGGCWNPDHGHPVPYTHADHVAANQELCRRVKAKYPRVWIEMHDMLAGGSTHRLTPVYYGYGVPGGYDENWGFELMWNPIEDLRSGRAHALYYYNLGCNVPVYLHIDLRDDNEHCVVLWWFASTCRHLGLGGTHANPNVVTAQQHALAKYRTLDRFYKRGEFVGISEEIHAHVMPAENAFVVNVFNLSDQPRRLEGRVPVAQLGIDPHRWYARTERWADFDAATGLFRVNCQLPAWGAQLIEFWAVA